MKHKRWMMALLLAGVIGALCLAQIKVGAKVKAFSTKALYGQTVKVSVPRDQLVVTVGSKEVRGKPLLLNFWG